MSFNEPLNDPQDEQDAAEARRRLADLDDKPIPIAELVRTLDLEGEWNAANAQDQWDGGRL